MRRRVVSLFLCLLMIMSAVSVLTAQAAPVVSVETLSITPYMGSYGEIKLNVTGATNVTYQWQAGYYDSALAPVDLDDNEYYIGTKTNHFKLLASGQLDTLEFRCKITYDGGSTYSQIFHFTFLDPKVISRAYVVGVDAPVFGYGPKYTTDTIESNQYKLDSMVWYGPITDSSAPLMKNTDIYVAGKYKCRFYLDPAKGYAFNENSDCSVDGIICDIKTETKPDGTTAYYADRVYTVSYKGFVPEGILAFESRTPSAPIGEQNVYMGIYCLGTSDMETEVKYTIRNLPASMSNNGYSIFGETKLIKDGDDVRRITGTGVKLSDLITEEGRYTLEQRISLMSPTLETMKTLTQSYIVDIVKPQTLTEVKVTFDSMENWVCPFYTPVAVTPGTDVKSVAWNDMTLDGKYVPAGTDFIDGHTYCMSMWIEAEHGYEFRTDRTGCADVLAEVNDMHATVISDLSSSKELIVNFDFTYEEKTTPQGILGDADEDKEVNIKDATLIQKYTASLETISEIGLILADADGDGDVNIKDATAIQKYIAGIDTGYNIGSSI